MPVNIDDLEHVAAQGCQVPGCTHENHGPFFLHAKCHIDAALEVSYAPGSGILLVACAECKEPVVTIAVARRRNFNEFQLCTMPRDVAITELVNRVYDGANFVHMLQEKQRIKHDVAQRMVEFLTKEMLLAWNEDKDPPGPSSGALVS